MFPEREEADALMRRLLQERGFDFDRPDPGTAWAAFLDFVVRPLPNLETITIGYECEHDAGRDGTLWLSFMRRVTEPSGSGWDCGCLLSLDAPPELWNVGESWWWWEEHGTIEEWRADVEGMRSFPICLAARGWRWEGVAG
ncbi:hypothetical protein [Paludisphaera soli]|uniref:hypothetical protein n=1 Tax=Paludisphaera soli TaxID=2712865 RepID=UPI0013EDE282|nr:hypothetical protein [Paludisphaera soli]